MEWYLLSRIVELKNLATTWLFYSYAFALYPRRSVELFKQRSIRLQENDSMGATVRPMAMTSAFIVGRFCPQGAVLSQTIPQFVRFVHFLTFLGLNVHKIKICAAIVLRFLRSISWSALAAHDSSGGRHGDGAKRVGYLGEPCRAPDARVKSGRS